MDKVRKKLIREKAVIAVYQYLLTHANDEEIESYLKNENVFDKTSNEYKLCIAMIKETIENLDDMQNSISMHLKKGWSIERLSKMELAILLVAVNEFKSNSKNVVINEAVELAKKYCDDDSYKFINGVLNKLG